MRIKFTKSLIASVIALSASYANAAAFQIAEVSTSGLGRAYAGEAAIAENASVVATNPALMTLFKQNEFSIGGVLINPNVSLDDETRITDPSQGRLGLGQVIKAEDSQQHVVPRSVVPNLYVVAPINDRLAVGGGVNVNFGLQSKFSPELNAGPFAGTTQLSSVNLNLSGAYRVFDRLSFGLGINAVYAKLTLERTAGIHSKLQPNNQLQPPPAPIKASDLISSLHDNNAWGLGWNAGLVYEFNANNRVGIAYHSYVDIKFEDHAAFEEFNQLKPASLTFNLPAYWEASGYHKLTEKFAINYSFKRTLWSHFKELKATFNDGQTVFYKPEFFKDSSRIAFGASYDVTDALTLRAGVAFDESPIVEPYKSAAIPDTDRTWYSFGATYNITKNLSVDLAYAHVKGKNSSFAEQPPEDPVFQLRSEFDSRLKMDLHGLNINYRF